MIKDSDKWLNLFLAVEDIEKIKKSFSNLTTEMLHQKIINLHNELNKKVDKNKNQALEITKLLEQKKDLQEINDTQNKYIKELEDMLEDERNHFMLKTSKHELKINELENLLKEKETIISYLESKLK